MHHKIAILRTNQRCREKMTEVYEWFVERITAEGGSYTTPKLDVLAKEIGGISANTLGKYLKQLVRLGLLTVDKRYNKKWRYARYSLPEGSVVEEDSVIEESLEFEAEEPKAEEEPQIDDFKPLATLELDGWEIVDEKGEKWVRSREIANHLGYANEDAIHVIYNRHQSFFKDGIDATTFILKAVDGKERETRVFSFTGGLKICRYSEMPKADEVMQQLIDIGDKVRRGEYPAKVSQIDEHITAWSEKWQKALLGDVLHPKFEQIDSNITQVKQAAAEAVRKVNDITAKVDNLVNQDVINNRQSEVDQYRHIVTWLKYWEMGYDYAKDKNKFGDISSSVCWQIKHDYGIPDAIPVTRIPNNLQERVLQDLRKSVFGRLEKRQPKDFYKLEERYRRFLISQGFQILSVSAK